MSEATQLFNAIEKGDAKAAEQLLPLVYEELRRLASSGMAHEAPGHTLQPTALVHEAWLRLVGDQSPMFQNRAQFFAAAAEAMRRILIESARRRQAARHGGGQQRVELEHVELPFPGDDDQLLAVNEALEQLASAHPFEAEVVKLRYFVGLTHDETAAALRISVRTAKTTGPTPGPGCSARSPEPRQHNDLVSGVAQRRRHALADSFGVARSVSRWATVIAIDRPLPLGRLGFVSSRLPYFARNLALLDDLSEKQSQINRTTHNHESSILRPV